MEATRPAVVAFCASGMPSSFSNQQPRRSKASRLNSQASGGLVRILPQAGRPGPIFGQECSVPGSAEEEWIRLDDLKKVPLRTGLYVRSSGLRPQWTRICAGFAPAPNSMAQALGGIAPSLCDRPVNPAEDRLVSRCRRELRHFLAFAAGVWPR